jgi:hypothetical protein
MFVALRASVLVEDRYQIIDCRTVVRSDVRRHVETMNGEVDERVELETSVFTVVALQIDDKNRRKRLEANFLVCYLWLITIWTMPENE